MRILILLLATLWYSVPSQLAPNVQQTVYGDPSQMLSVKIKSVKVVLYTIYIYVKKIINNNYSFICTVTYNCITLLGSINLTGPTVMVKYPCIKYIKYIKLQTLNYKLAVASFALKLKIRAIRICVVVSL